MKRKQDKMKILNGTNRPDRASKNVELPDQQFPECPAWLDQVGKETWARVSGVMASADVGFDMELLATYCDSYSHMVACSQVLRIEGYSTISDGGLAKINPAVNALRELQKTLLDAGKQLGLSADARSKAGINFRPKETNPLAEFLRGECENG